MLWNSTSSYWSSGNFHRLDILIAKRFFKVRKSSAHVVKQNQATVSKSDSAVVAVNQFPTL